MIGKWNEKRLKNWRFWAVSPWIIFVVIPGFFLLEFVGFVARRLSSLANKILRLKYVCDKCLFDGKVFRWIARGDK